MKSYKNNKTEVFQKLKDQKRKTPQDIISKSLLIARRIGQHLILILNF